MYRMLVCLKIFFSENKKEELNFFKKEKKKKKECNGVGSTWDGCHRRVTSGVKKKMAGKIYGMLQGCMSANNNNNK